ncbi:MAG: glycosyltransferase family 2 protein [Pelagibacteraceae bacterium TMED124]|nr:hypothetical protein [Candidatus Neomarinimicrobiota bacterium]RPG17196.1 MAG: glycosyltransferase family 2 protein [Pelagibacteraceae bacterium TMED124]
MNNIVISVIIPVYNSEKYIERSIKSVVNQSYKKLELIVVDDCSTDKTWSLIQGLKKKYNFKALKLEKNSGTPGKPRNVGITKSKGKLISFLDADDYWHKDKLQYQIKHFKKNHINCLNTEYFDIENNKAPIFIRLFRLFLINIFTILINYKKSMIFFFNPIILSSVLIEKSVFKKIIFSEKKNFAGIEDLYIWFKIISEKKFDILFLNKTFVYNFRGTHTLHRDYSLQSIRSINILSSLKLEGKIAASSSLIIFTTVIKLIRELIRIILSFLYKKKKSLVISIVIIYFFTFYSPLFHYIGKPLLYNNQHLKSFNNTELVVVNTNYGYDKYFNFGFSYRLKDLVKNKKYFLNKRILLLGSNKYIPQKLIIKGLLIESGYDTNNIFIVLESLKSKKEELEYIYNVSNINNLKNISYFTSPYNTRYTEIIYNNYYVNNYNLIIHKSNDWPEDDHQYFKRFSYKKMIISEYFNILRYKFLALSTHFFK